MNDLNRYNRLRRRVSVVQSFSGALHGGTLLLQGVLQWFNSYRLQYLACIRNHI